MKNVSIISTMLLITLLTGCGSDSDNSDAGERLGAYEENLSMAHNEYENYNPNDLTNQINNDNQPNNNEQLNELANRGNNPQITSSGDTLTPPTWIQGTWMDRREPLFPTGWLFTADDVYTMVGENSISLTADGLQEGDSIDQSSSDVRYEFTIHHQNSTETYIFNKLSETQINYENPLTGGTTGPFIKE